MQGAPAEAQKLGFRSDGALEIGLLGDALMRLIRSLDAILPLLALGRKQRCDLSCTGSMCRRLIAFQKTVHSGDQPNLRFAVIGEPSVNCPHCGMLVRIRVDQIERRPLRALQSP